MFNRILSLSLAAGMTVLLPPTLASAQSIVFSKSPVAVTACNVNGSFASSGSLFYNPTIMPSSNISLSFANTSKVGATGVKVVFSDGRFTQTLTDRGSFSPGVLIEHTFESDLGLGSNESATCTVTKVDFANGTSWSADRHDVVKR